MTIGDMIHEAHTTAVEKGWWDSDRSVGDQFANFHAEIAEAWEEFRDGHAFDEIYYGEGGKPEGIAVELADLFIRVADTCGKYGIPLDRAIQEKLAFNMTRPYRHGGKKA